MAPPFPSLASPLLCRLGCSQPPPFLYWCVFYPPFGSASCQPGPRRTPPAPSWSYSHFLGGLICARAAVQAISLGVVLSLIEPQPISDALGVEGIAGEKNTRRLETGAQLAAQGPAPMQRGAALALRNESDKDIVPNHRLTIDGGQKYGQREGEARAE